MEAEVHGVFGMLHTFGFEIIRSLRFLLHPAKYDAPDNAPFYGIFPVVEVVAEAHMRAIPTEAAFGKQMRGTNREFLLRFYQYNDVTLSTILTP